MGHKSSKGYPGDSPTNGGSQHLDGTPALNDFELMKVIGKGSYGKVLLVKRNCDAKVDGQVFAMKILRKEDLVRRNQVEHTKSERKVLEAICHPFIVNLHYAFQSPKKLHLVLEYCPGGELFFHLSRAGRFSEGRARFYAAEVCLAIAYLHGRGIIYRDLKPENILLDSQGHVKITDFGLSKQGILDNISAKSMCGTPEYLAPEIINQIGHGRAVDWWSFGAIIYEMLTGLPPFYSTDHNQLYELIKTGTIQFPPYISPWTQALISSLMHRDPNLRLGGGVSDGEEVKRHDFFAGVDWFAVYDRQVKPPFTPSVSHEADVKYFEEEFLNLPVANSEDNLFGAEDVKYFEGFSYTKDALASKATINDAFINTIMSL